MTAAVTVPGEAAGMTNLEPCGLPVELPSAVPLSGEACMELLPMTCQQWLASSML